MRSAEVTASHTSAIGGGVGLRERLHAGGFAVDVHRLHAARHGVDLGIHIDHVRSPRSSGCGFVLGGLARMPSAAARRRVGESPGSAPARQLGAECVEVRQPEAAERVEPCDGRFEGRGIDRVHAAHAVGPHRCETGLAQHAKML